MAVEMECGIVELVSPIPPASKSYSATTQFTAADFIGYIKPVNTIAPGATKAKYYVVGYNNQLKKEYSAAWDGSTTSTVFGATWPDGYYRIHIRYIYYDNGVLRNVNIETKPIYWNRSIISYMTYVPAGRYECGSPATEVGRSSDETQHYVTVSTPFYIGRTQATNAQFVAVTGIGTSTANTPVASIAWAYFDYLGRHYQNSTWYYTGDSGYTPFTTASKFIYQSTGRASAGSSDTTQTGLGFMDLMNQDVAVTGRTWRLPFEFEWEYAARAGAKSAYPNGTNPLSGSLQVNLNEFAWYTDNNTLNSETSGTKVVARKRPNRWGMYDVLGNVWEWLEDDKRSYSVKPQTDPKGKWSGGSSNSSARANRGGSYGNAASYCRLAGYRNNSYVPGSTVGFGLRLLLQ